MEDLNFPNADDIRAKLAKEREEITVSNEEYVTEAYNRFMKDMRDTLSSGKEYRLITFSHVLNNVAHESANGQFVYEGESSKVHGVFFQEIIDVCGMSLAAKYFSAVSVMKDYNFKVEQGTYTAKNGSYYCICVKL